MTNLRIPAWMRMCGVFAVLVACVGCSSTGKFGTGNQEADYKAITDYSPKFKNTGNVDMDRIGKIAVIAIEDKKPELDVVVARLWSERELNYLMQGARAELKVNNNGLAWSDASPRQRQIALNYVYVTMSPEEQTKINQFQQAEGPAVAAANDDAADLAIILMNSLNTAESIYSQFSNADVGQMLAYGLSEGPRIWDGVEQIQEMDQWANGINMFISYYSEAMDSWDEVLKYNREKANE